MRSLGVDMDDKDNVSADGWGGGGALFWEPGQEQVIEESALLGFVLIIMLFAQFLFLSCDFDFGDQSLHIEL